MSRHVVQRCDAIGVLQGDATHLEALVQLTERGAQYRVYVVAPRQPVNEHPQIGRMFAMGNPRSRDGAIAIREVQTQYFWCRGGGVQAVCRTNRFFRVLQFLPISFQNVVYVRFVHHRVDVTQHAAVDSRHPKLMREGLDVHQCGDGEIQDGNDDAAITRLGALTNGGEVGGGAITDLQVPLEGKESIHIRCAFKLVYLCPTGHPNARTDAGEGRHLCFPPMCGVSG